jgi:glutaminyl-peptide cyclotransferase
LLPEEDRLRDTDVLNGIAIDPVTESIWVTGKRWPWLFEITLENDAD